MKKLALILITISLSSISPSASAQVGDIFRGIGEIVDAIEKLNEQEREENSETEIVSEELDEPKETEKLPEFPDQNEFKKLDLDQF